MLILLMDHSSCKKHNIHVKDLKKKNVFHFYLTIKEPFEFNKVIVLANGSKIQG